MLPTLIAGVRGKSHGQAGIALLNNCLGWTLLGWLVAFIWACSGRTVADERRDERRHRELLTAMRPAQPSDGHLVATADLRNPSLRR